MESSKFWDFLLKKNCVEEFGVEFEIFQIIN